MRRHSSTCTVDCFAVPLVLQNDLDRTRQPMDWILGFCIISSGNTESPYGRRKPRQGPADIIYTFPCQSYLMETCHENLACLLNTLLTVRPHQWHTTLRVQVRKRRSHCISTRTPIRILTIREYVREEYSFMNNDVMATCSWLMLAPRRECIAQCRLKDRPFTTTCPHNSLIPASVSLQAQSSQIGRAHV